MYWVQLHRYEVCEKSTRKMSAGGGILYREARLLNISYSTLHYEQKLLMSADWARQLSRARRAGPRLVTSTPRTGKRKSSIRNFAARLAIAGKGFYEIKKPATVEKGEQALQKTQIYSIIKNVKAEKKASDQRKRPLQTPPPLPPPFLALFRPPWKKLDILSPGILPQLWLI